VEVDDISEERKVVTYRGKSERGEEWSSEDEMKKLMTVLEAKLVSPAYQSFHNPHIDTDTDSPNRTPVAGYGSFQDNPLQQLGMGSIRLAERWRQLVVGVMSARDHDFGSALANAFYRPEVGCSALSLSISRLTTVLDR
jgi:hypothetical protein